MSTNISKQKREDLLNKIKEIRTFISAAPQDENTGNLLSYLSDLEKDVNGKKYGLVFEEHREEIDEVLDTHTPVLSEEKDLFIDNGGHLNFLIEGDTVIFGEAKYVAATTAYSSALPQIVDFIKDGKDVEDLPELKPFCTTSALQRAAVGRKGFSAAFSAKTTSTDKIIANITKRPDFQSLLQYEELILVAVDL